MPYKIYRSGERHCVHRLNSDNTMGDQIPGGCHPTRDQAVAHLRAMYASESKEITDVTLSLLKEIAADDQDSKPERAAAVLDEWKARIGAVPDDEEELDEEDTPNTDPPDEDDKAVDTEKQAKPRKKDLLGKLKEVAEAIASWFKSDPEPEDDGAIGGGYKNATGMSIWKENDVYWWMARYSNNYRDNDHPPEIISAASHKRFLQLVKEGRAPLPELRLFHKKEWKVGRAHGLAYDELGFAVAIGTFDPDKGHVAEALMKSKERTLVSHGMPITSIRRDIKDPTVIIEHETREISPLPAWAAANKLTGFVVLNLESKEDSMAIPDETKQDWIINMGLSPKTLESLEEANAKDAEKATEEGLENKEADDTTELAQPATQEVTSTEVPPTPAPAPQSSEVTLDALRTAVQEAVTGIVAPVIERMNTLEEGLKSLKEANQIQAEVLKGTPTASLTALLGQFAQSAIGAPENKVDGRETLAKSKPKETAAPARSPIPFINEMLTAADKQ